MGFREGTFARIWSVNDEGKYSTANISISKKNEETGEYNVEFSDGYVRLVGSAHKAAKELGLPTREDFDYHSDKGITIKISSCDVTHNYDAEAEKLYINYVIFGFEIPDNNNGGKNTKTKSVSKGKKSAVGSKKNIKSATKQEEIELELEDDELPF